MGMECSIRTDLAVETQESLKKTNSNLRGVNYSEEKRKDDIKVSVVTIETENASKLTGRPRGRYVTIEAPQMTEDDELYRQSVSEEFAGVLKKILFTIKVVPTGIPISSKAISFPPSIL